MDQAASRLLDAALRDDTLLAAWQRVHDNAGAPGVDGVSIAQFGAALLAEIARLRSAIRAGTYTPLPLRRILLPRPGKTPRLLAVPCVRDRLVQSAVAHVLTPLIDPDFEDFSFGYRPGRSVPLAVQRICDARDCGLRWVAEADIQSCFDVIPWPAVRRRLQARLPDDSLLPLIDAWLTLPMRAPSGRLIARKRGVPQGSPLSPLLANLFLDGLDKALADGPWRAVRYADDFVLLAASETDARQGLGLARHWLAGQGMALADDKTRLVTFEHGFSFLGVHFQGDTLRTDKPGAEPWLLPRHQRAGFSAHSPAAARPKGGEPASPAQPPERPRAAQPRLPAAEAAPGQGDHPAPTPANAASSPPSPPQVPAPASSPENSGGGQALSRRAHPASAEPPGDAAPVGEPDSFPPGEADGQPPPEPAATAAARQLAAVQPPAAVPPPRLRSLYLTEPGCYLHIDGERYIVGLREEELAAIPADKLDLVLADTEGAVSFGALRMLARHDGALLLTPAVADAPAGLFTPMNGRQVQLRARQFQRLSDGPWRLRAASAIVQAKIANARVVLRRYRRNREQGLDDPDPTLSRLQAQCPAAPDLDTLRGVEGAAARAYFDALAALLGPQWGFDSRNRQPPRDPINAMLSYGYTILFHTVHALILRRGLDPFVGALHSIKDGHAALASDLMEPYRALVVDATVLSLHTRGQITPAQCAGEEPGRLPLDVRRRLIRELERKLNAPAGRADADNPPPDDDAHLTPRPPAAQSPAAPKDWRRIIARDVHGWAEAVMHGPEHYTPWRAR